MTAVDPEDDTIARWVIHHYRYDEARHERRNVAVAAYDDVIEFQAEFERYAVSVRAEIAAGSRDTRERVNGVYFAPGRLAAQARRAIEHGVKSLSIGDGDKELPSGMAILSAERDLLDRLADEPEPENEAVTVSLTFYFATDPQPVPAFLVGRRGTYFRVAAYGFKMHSTQPDYDLRSDEVTAFLDATIESFPDEINPDWLARNDCYLRAHVTPHPGNQNGGLRISSATLGKLAEAGAYLEMETI